MKIGDLDLGERPVVLAPMEDVTDMEFRRLCKGYGADMVYTEFVSADAIVRDVRSSMKKLDIADAERPAGVQIYGREIGPMVEAAQIVEQSGPDVIDINFGCPVKKIAGKGAGAGMLRNVPKMVEMTRQVVRAVRHTPVTVKTRLGWDEASLNIVETAEMLQDVGISALTIHGRTRAQMYTGEADWTLIGEVKRNPRMRIPIIGNGDITDGPGAREAFERHGVDAIMIGRASIGRPWVFEEVKHYLATGEALPPPDAAEVARRLMRQIDDTVAQVGDERRALVHLRRHMAVSFKGVANFKERRVALLRAERVEEVKEILNQLTIDS